MNRAGRMDRLGWIATRPQSLAGVAAFAGLLGVALGAAGCASAPRAEAVSTTTTTSASAYTPGAVELYAARQGTPASGGCGTGLLPTIEFARRSAELPPGQLADVDRWASCLQRPELEHMNVVLLGGERADGPEGLFYQRSNQLRNALILRGVDPARIIIAPTNATREGGPWAGVEGVRLEVTHLVQLRDLAAPDPSVRRAVR